MSALLRFAGMFAVPGAMLLSRQLIDFEDPTNLFFLHLVVGLVTGAMIVVLVFFYVQIITSPKKDSTVFVKPSQLYSVEFQGFQDTSGPDSKVEMTYSDYDLTKLKDLFGRVVLSTAMTLGVYAFLQAPPVLIAAIFVQPRLILSSPLFRVYIRRQDERIYRELKRPWAEAKPGFAQKWQQKYLDYLKAIDQPEATATGVGKKSGKKKVKSK